VGLIASAFSSSYYWSTGAGALVSILVVSSDVLNHNNCSICNVIMFNHKDYNQKKLKS